MTVLLTLLLSNIVFAGCLAILAMVLTRVWRNPHLAHGLWLLVLVKLVTPPILQVPLPQFILTNTEANAGKEDARVLPHPSPSRMDSSSPDRASPTIDSTSLPASSRPHHGVNIRTRPRPALAMNWPPWLLAGWCIGTLLLACVALRRHLRLCRVIATSQFADGRLREDARGIAKQMGLSFCPPLRVTQAHVCPLVACGFRKQVVLLPQRLLAELSREQIRSVLAHELAHIRRRDHWIRIFEVLVLTLYWWNPLAWWASRQMREAEEECCDAWVVWALPEDRRTYGQTLLRTTEYLTRDKVLSAAGISFGGCQLERRIDVILNQTVNRKISRAACVLTAVMGAMFLPIAFTQVLSADPPATAPDAHVQTSPGDTEPSDSSVANPDKALHHADQDDDQRAELPALPGRIFAFAQIRYMDQPKQIQFDTLVSIDPNTNEWDFLHVKGHSVRVSPDGKSAAFSAHSPGMAAPFEVVDGAIWVCGTRTRGQRRELHSAIRQLRRVATIRGAPVWSPDGKVIVASDSRLSAEGKRETMAQIDGQEIVPEKPVWANVTRKFSLDGGPETQLAVPPTDAVDDWSPDGRWFVTNSDRHAPFGRGYQLYLMRNDGSQQRRLTQSGLNVHARFSPDGKRIVYVHQEKGENSVRSLNIDDGSETVVLKDDATTRVGGAAWSPDGMHFVVKLEDWIKNEQGGYDLKNQRFVIVDLAGNRLSELAPKRADVEFLGHPDWK